MDIQLEKIELMKKLLQTNDESVIESIKNIFSTTKKDWWDELTEQQKFEILEGERQIERGEFVLYEDIRKKHR